MRDMVKHVEYLKMSQPWTRPSSNKYLKPLKKPTSQNYATNKQVNGGQDNISGPLSNEKIWEITEMDLKDN